MSAIAFDTLRFARRLKEAGVPEKQAEAQAEVMAETFVYNMDSLVTTDYLDARFAEQDARIDARLIEQDARLDAQIGSLEARINKRFTEQSEAFAIRFTAMDINFTELKGELGLHRWILAAIAASTVLPALKSVFSLAWLT